MKKDRNERSAFLKQLSTSQLEKILRKDIDFDGTDNQDMIFEILSILKDRDQGKSPETDGAWQEFKEHYNISDGEGMSLYPTAETTAKKKGKKHIGLRKLAVAAAAVLVLVCALPPALGAVNIIELIAQWTNEEFAFLNSEREPREEYEFIYSTDNPDLQEIHDAVQELGVTENVVPSWIPDGFEKAREISISDLYSYQNVSTLFEDANGNTIKFTAKVYSDCSKMGSTIYEKDETEIRKIEIENTEHYLMKNNDYWVIIWTVDNVECMLTSNIDQTELIQIADSIYCSHDDYIHENSGQEPREKHEFIYSTENPDLQEIHDAVQELGVTENVVPSWIPDGFEMIEFDISDLYAYDHLSTFFKNESGDTIKFTATIYSNREAMGGSNYEKDETEVEIIELNDTTYYIMSNIDKWVAVWEKDNVECMIGTSLEKEELLEIINSIYEEQI